ncbi:MAG: hypothetical protein ACRD4B_10020, partial [Acidobacteriota bacterium]
MQQAPQDQTTIRISFGGLLLALLFLLAVGVGGGVLGARYGIAPLPPLTSEIATERLVATVQEVTLSPSTAHTDLIKDRKRSVIALGQVTGSSVTLRGLAAVITNDGLLVSTIDTSSFDNLSAFTADGTRVAVAKVGDDTLYGLTYYRLQNNVLTPFELASNDPSPGQDLIALSRAEATLEPDIAITQVRSYKLPPESRAAGVLRYILFDEEVSLLPGTPILDEEGRVAAISVGTGEDRALPVTYLTSSLNRVTQGRREYNPFTQFGFTVSPEFVFRERDNALVFSLQVATITPGLAA